MGHLPHREHRRGQTHEKRHREVPWALLVAMRNVLAHDYFGVNVELVWNTVESDLLDLRYLILNRWHGSPDRSDFQAPGIPCSSNRAEPLWRPGWFAITFRRRVIDAGVHGVGDFTAALATGMGPEIQPRPRGSGSASRTCTGFLGQRGIDVQFAVARPDDHQWAPGELRPEQAFAAIPIDT